MHFTRASAAGRASAVSSRAQGVAAESEAALQGLRDDLSQAYAYRRVLEAQLTEAREKADEVFKSEMLRKMAVVEKDLEIETKNREASEEQLVNALYQAHHFPPLYCLSSCCQPTSLFPKNFYG